MPIRLVRRHVLAGQVRAARRARTAASAGPPGASSLGHPDRRRHGVGEQRLERTPHRSPPSMCRRSSGSAMWRRMNSPASISSSSGRRGRHDWISLGSQESGLVPSCHRCLRASPPDAVAGRFPRRRASAMRRCFPALPSRAVRLPERFRGGCSFGAATLAALKALPTGDVDTSTVAAGSPSRWERRSPTARR